MHAHRSRWMAHGMVAAIYLVLAVAMWWGVWSGHPTSTATCGCGDTSIVTWFMAWPSYALTHGQSLLFSTRVLHPGGVNLPANTSFLAISLPLAPVTWLFGPVASLNVAATLAPVAAALSARGLLLRWTTWWPAAFVAGLFYGFSPFVIENLSLEHVEFATLVVPPLLVLCLDELLVRQRGRAWLWGLGLGGLCAIQFFISSEVLAMCALAGAIGTVLLVVACLVRAPSVVARRWRHALVGLGVAAGSAVVLLAYPAWYAVAGPQGLPHRVWPYVQYFGSDWRSLFFPATPHDRGPNAVLETYGYFGSHPLLLGYLGLGMTAVLVVGLAWFRSDRRLWFFGGLLVIVEGMSLGAREWPWRLFDHLPLVANIVPDRFAAVADLFAAIMFGLIVDHAHGSGLRWPRRDRATMQSTAPSPAQSTAPSNSSTPTRSSSRLAPATVAAWALTALALVPIAVAYRLPFTTRSVDVPPWFTTVGALTPTSAVVLTYPFASSGLRAPMTWQAVGTLRWSMVGGGSITPDPPAHPTPSERLDARAAADLSNASDGYGPLPSGTSAESARLRQAIRDWGVTTVVIPSEVRWPASLRGRSVPVAVAYMTATLGVGPVQQADAWVWTVATHLAPARVITADEFVGCTTGPDVMNDPGRAADCVLAAPRGTAH